MQFWQTRQWVKREITMIRLDEIVLDRYLLLMSDWEKEFVHYWWFNCELIHDSAIKKVRDIYRKCKE
jgi:isochorismate hydrolase